MEILIIDDEPMAVNALVTATDWSKLGISKIWSASGITEAISIIYDEDIQIVLCDIELRGENGLHFVNWLQSHKPNVQCIMVTSHVNFEYTRKALQFHVVDYLSKPVDEGQLKTAIKEALSRIKAEAPDHGSNNRHDAPFQYTEAYNDSIVEQNEEISDQNQKGSFFTIFISVTNWNENYDDSDRERFFRQIINTLETEYLREYKVSFILKDETACLYSQDPKVTRSIVDEVLQKFIVFCKYYYLTELNYEINTDVELLSLKDTYDDFINRKKRQPSDSIEDSVASKIIKYINLHIGEEISRNSLAEVFYMSPDHLAKVFKKETGLKLSQYIIDKKMEAAKGLLKNAELSVTFIASSVGYSNISHFTEAFRKKYSKTPTEYRRNIIIEDNNGNS